MKLSQNVVNWLHLVVQAHYEHTDVTYAHVYQYLAVFLEQGFKVRTSVYTSSAGSLQLLLNLHGGVGGATVNVYLPLNYPFALGLSLELDGAPVVYVVVPAGMRIRPSNNVDGQGRFYHPFLAQWHQQRGAGSEFTLVELVRIVKSTLEKAPVVEPLRQTTGPPLPEKPGFTLPRAPPKVPQVAPQVASHVAPQAGQVGAGQAGAGQAEAGQPGVPAKYLSPLPLPTETPLPQPRPYPKSPSPPQANPVSQIEDLMDKVSIEGPQSVDEGILQSISALIDRIIAERVATYAPVAELGQKVDTLHSHLQHVLTQAQANSAHLQSHIDYVEERLAQLTRLTGDLLAMDQESDDSYVSTGAGTIAVDELVVADLQLVHQLYDVCAEISSYKDAILAVCGVDGREIISNDNLGACVKEVRGMARALFWQECLRLEIGHAMLLEG